MAVWNGPPGASWLAELRSPPPIMRRAIYPGTFDPVTSGHIGIVCEAAQLFDHVTVAVGINPGKVPLFSPDERVQMLRDAIAEEGVTNVTAEAFTGLTVDFARECGSQFIVRGLRAVTDFEAEFALVLGNEQLDSSIKTVFVIPSQRHIYLSSSIVRQAAELGHRVIPGSVPISTEMKLREKFGF
jgi:pantetheine-phosphate adenylyltransferase